MGISLTAISSEEFVTRTQNWAVPHGKQKPFTISLHHTSNREFWENTAEKYATNNWHPLKKLLKRREYREKQNLEAEALGRRVEWLELEFLSPSKKSLHQVTLDIEEREVAPLFEDLSRAGLQHNLFRIQRIYRLLVKPIPKVTTNITPRKTWALEKNLIVFSHLSTWESTAIAVEKTEKVCKKWRELSDYYQTTINDLSAIGTPAQVAILRTLRSIAEKQTLKAVEFAENLLSKRKAWIRMSITPLPAPETDSSMSTSEKNRKDRTDWIRTRRGNARPSTESDTFTTLGALSMVAIATHPFLTIAAGVASLAAYSLVSTHLKKNKNDPSLETYDNDSSLETYDHDYPPFQDNHEMAHAQWTAMNSAVPFIVLKDGKAHLNFSTGWLQIREEPFFLTEYLEAAPLIKEGACIWHIYDKESKVYSLMKCGGATSRKIKKIYSCPPEEKTAYLSTMKLSPSYTDGKFTSIEIRYPSKWDKAPELTESHWAVTLTSVGNCKDCKKGEESYGHAMLCFEGIRDGIPFISYGDLSLDRVRLEEKASTSQLPNYVHEHYKPREARTRTSPLFAPREQIKKIMDSIQEDVKRRKLKVDFKTIFLGTTDTTSYCLAYVIEKLQISFPKIPSRSITTLDPDAYIKRNSDKILKASEIF